MKKSPTQGDPQHLQLGPEFFDPVKAASFPQTILRYRNQAAAAQIGLDDLSDADWINHFARFTPFTENIPQPIALRYHGHQFQNYNPQLGDGRGFLFAQFRDLTDGRLLDLGTKGSGTTPWSRRGDGRLTLKGAVREVLATEMLEALCVTTSKTLSVIETGENLERHDEPSPTRAAVLVRLNHSHIRYGSFQRPAALQKPELVEQLLRYSIKTYFPHIENETRHLAAVAAGAIFLREVVKGAANLCAEWMLAGFVHGVLNTDNMNITGESFDYGPYRFMPIYDPSFTAAYFDESGLYAYGRQPEIVLWNLEQLASSLAIMASSAADVEPANESSGESLPAELVPLQEALMPYSDHLNAAMTNNLQRRLGVEATSREVAEDLIRSVFEFLFHSKCGFEQFFFDWYGGTASAQRAAASTQSDLYLHPGFAKLRALFEHCRTTPQALARLRDSYFARKNPCSLLIDEIEAIWKPIAEKDDWSLFEAKVQDIRALRELMRDGV